MWSLLLASTLVAQTNPDFEEAITIEKLHLKKGEVYEMPAARAIYVKRLIVDDEARILLKQEVDDDLSGAGVDGVDGPDATFFFDHVDGHVLIEASGGHGGDGRQGRNGVRGTMGGKGRDAFRLLWFHLGQGSRGQPGSAGEDGEDGQDGGNGGDGGHVKVFFKRKSVDSHIYVDVSAGPGGRGGQGGRGGLGGIGGPGGKGIHNGPQGQMGASGQNGRPGRPGVPGTPGYAAVLQLNSALYECLLTAYLLYEEDSFRGEECYLP